MPKLMETYSEAEAIEKLTDLPGWEMDEGWIKRIFKTPSFFASMVLANTVAQIAEAAQHHPDMKISYRKVSVKFLTHSANGLTDKDFLMAKRLNEVLDWQPPAPLG